jgi:hypothetical protein
MSITRTSVAVAGLLVFTSIASAQSLGDVAKKEEARRKTVKAPSKVYTNGDLRSDGTAPPPSAPATPQPGAAGTQQVPPSPSGVQPKDGDKPAADEPQKDEAYWKARVAKARDDLDRAKTFAEALQSRINALTADFSARSDPAQRAVVGSDRNKALAELDRVKKEIDDHTKEIASIQEEARKANVPAGWVR